jgi:phosphatidylserine/phosphatidylglycerophosphate/cardiolipin synthase-like enzyme
MSHRCVVCQEEITDKEESYSIKFYNMALCRKHQEIQKQIKAKAENEQKANAPSISESTLEKPNYCCVVCQEEITPKEYSYSTNLFNMALCRKHQDIQKQIKAKTEGEQKSSKVSTEDKIPPKVEEKEPEPKVQKANILEKTQDSLIQWLTEWVNTEPINVDLQSKHFFLEGMRLEEFSRKAIGKAKDEIIVANPYLDSCYLATALQEARDRRVNVKIVTRRPTKDKENISKIECHAALRKKGVTIHYYNTIHAKIIVIDRKVAILSSMNLYSNSAGGGVLEAGIVSFEEKVVTSQAKYITDLLEKTESPDITSYNKYYGHR